MWESTRSVKAKPGKINAKALKGPVCKLVTMPR